MTQEEQIEQLLNRVEYLESVVVDLMDIFIDNKDAGRDFGEFTGNDAQDLKKSFEKLIKDY